MRGTNWSRLSAVSSGLLCPEARRLWNWRSPSVSDNVSAGAEWGRAPGGQQRPTSVGLLMGLFSPPAHKAWTPGLKPHGAHIKGGKEGRPTASPFPRHSNAASASPYSTQLSVFQAGTILDFGYLNPSIPALAQMEGNASLQGRKLLKPFPANEGATKIQFIYWLFCLKKCPL